ncbi:MAG TPA: hypothetical protein PKX92_04200 [Edaphocola sp.]|nr:hypothetical protein [Edaphocola sp.]
MAIDNLWLLIQALSPQEKRFFKRDFLKIKELETPPLFVQLFDIISKQRDFNENEILKSLSPQLNKSNLAYTKNYLFEQLCDALVRIDSQSESDAQLNKELNLIKIFRKKGLYHHALKIWKRAIQYARKMEKFSHVLLLKDEYKKLQLYSNPNVKQSDLQFEYDSSVIVMGEYNKLIQLQELQFKILLLRRRTHFNFSEADKKELDRMIGLNIINERPISKSFLILHYFLNTNATLYYLKGSPECYQYAYENIIKWQQQKIFIENHTEYYLEALYIFYYAAILAKQYDHIEDIMNHPINNTLDDHYLQSYFEAIKFLALNRIYNIMGDYNKVAEVIQKVKQNIKKWDNLVNTEIRRTLFISIGIACFALEDFEDAFYFTKQGLFSFNDESRKDQYSFANLFLLIISFELKDRFLLEQQYKSAYNYFYKNEKPLPFEKKILQAIMKASSTPNRMDQKHIFQELLNTLEKTKSNPIQQSVFNYFNIPAWLESKINRVPYKEWVTRKLKE